MPGFGIRVTSTGVRSFVLNYSCRRARTPSDHWPFSGLVSTAAAREEARRFRQLIDLGVDPLEHGRLRRRHCGRARVPTFGSIQRYMANTSSKGRTSAADDRSMWEKIILPRLGRAGACATSHSGVSTPCTPRSAETRPVRANRVIEVTRKGFNLAIRWGWRSDNPASGVHRNQEQKRTRYLSAPELVKLSQALATHSERASANAIRLLMLTGARRGEVLCARWEMFDLAAGVWTKPSSHTKQRREHRVPLSQPARQLLAEMLEQSRTVALEQGAISPYLFPGRDGKPLTDIKRTWLSVCREAGLAARIETRAGSTSPRGRQASRPRFRTTVRIHDLRHTYASILASEGLSLPIIGALLGHTQAQTTSRYAHLLDDPLRAATERVGAIVAPPRERLL